MLKSNIIKSVVRSVVLVALLFSCSDETPNALDGDYFPLTLNKEWVYQRRINVGKEHEHLWDTLTFKVDGDTLFENMAYKKITDSSHKSDRLVRVEGSRYFVRTYETYVTGIDPVYFSGYSEEHLFLDTSKPAGYSWAGYDKSTLTKTVSIIKSKSKTIAIEGNKYNNVIEVDVDYYEKEGDTYVYWMTLKYFYAKDIGEVYRYTPSPFSGLYANLSYFLINQNQ